MEMMHIVYLDCLDGQCACGAGLSSCLSSFASFHLSPSLAGGVWLFRCLSLLVSLHLAPVLAGGIRLFGRISSFVSLHLFPTLSSGVRLSGCLFRALTCLSSCVFRHVSPNLPVSRSLPINFSPVIGLP